MDLTTLVNNPPDPDIVIGACYWLKIRVKIKEGYIVRRRQYRAVAKYSNFVMLETDRGVRECFTMWELSRIIE